MVVYTCAISYIGHTSLQRRQSIANRPTGAAQAYRLQAAGPFCISSVSSAIVKVIILFLSVYSMHCRVAYMVGYHIILLFYLPFFNLNKQGYQAYQCYEKYQFADTFKPKHPCLAEGRTKYSYTKNVSSHVRSFTHNYAFGNKDLLRRVIGSSGKCCVQSKSIA